MLNAVQTLKEVHEHGIDTAQSMPDVIVITEEMIATEGAWFAQGDVNFTPIPAIPRGAMPAKGVSQLAPGTSKGSRHCVRSTDMPNVEFFAFLNPGPLEGPILRFNRPTTIEHPEHKDHLYPAGVIVAVTFQRAYAEDLRRSID